MKATLSFVVREFDFDDVLVASSGEEKKERRKETNGERRKRVVICLPRRGNGGKSRCYGTLRSLPAGTSFISAATRPHGFMARLFRALRAYLFLPFPFPLSLLSLVALPRFGARAS